jgi:hypothetical protein
VKGHQEDSPKSRRVAAGKIKLSNNTDVGLSASRTVGK